MTAATHLKLPPVTTAGVYVPTTIPIESASSKIKPWVMTGVAIPRRAASGADFGDLDQGFERNSRDRQQHSAKRTAEQTTIARFWFFTGPRTYNTIVRQIASNRKMDLVDCARLYALTAMAGADAFIAVFEAKYAYNLWRPVTAIRNADITSNPATPREASWLPLGTTPMHPEYPCAHCIVASAVSTVLQHVVGKRWAKSHDEPDGAGVTRKWTRLQDYSDEVSSARIYAGSTTASRPKPARTWEEDR